MIRMHPVRLEPEDPLPTSLGVVPLRSVVLFPGMVTPLVAVRPPASTALSVQHHPVLLSPAADLCPADAAVSF